MEKETLLTGFKSIIGDPDERGDYKDLGITSKTLDAYLTALSATTGDEVAENFYQSHAEVLKSMGGQLRHEKADFVKNYKPKATQPNEGDDVKPEPDTRIETQIAELIAENKKLRERFEEAEAANAQKQMLRKVREEMRRQHADDEYVLSKTLTGVTFDLEKSVEDNATELLKNYDKELSACRGDGATPRATSSGQRGKTEVDAYFEAKKRKLAKSE